MQDLNSTIGKRLRVFAEDHFETLAEFARELRITAPNLYKYLNDEREPKAGFLEKVAALGCNVNWLLTGRGEPSRADDGMRPFSAATISGGRTVPLFLAPVPAGAPTPGYDHVEEMLDVAELALPNPSSCFACRVTGDSMEGAGIGADDYLVVDREKEILPGDIVVCSLDGELTVKRLERMSGETYLFPENPKYQAVRVDEAMDLRIWGVVVRVIKITG